MNQPIKEAVLELLRVVVLAIIPVLITSLESGAVDFRSITVIAGVAALRFIDKLLHEIGKEKGNRLVKGLTQF